MYLGENIKTIRENWELSQEEFGLLINATRGMVMQYEKRGSMPKQGVIKRLVSVTGLTLEVLTREKLEDDEIPSISPTDYMFIENYRASPDDYSVVQPETVSKREIETFTKPQGNCFIIPLKAFGGFLTGYKNKVFLNSLEKSYFPNIVGECYSFEVEGYSMFKHKVIDGEIYELGYKPGSFVITTAVEDYSDMVKGRDYVFATIDGIIIKRFVKIKGDECYLSCINDEYNPAKTLQLKTIKKIFYVQKRYA